MIIKKLSKNFTPIHQGILFSIESDDAQPTNFIVEIVEATTNTVLATQQMHNTAYAKINVAPYLILANRHKPSTAPISTFAEAPAIRCKVRVDNTESEEIVVSVNNHAIAFTPAIVTSYPLSRCIARGERDEILVLTDPSGNLLAKITSNKGEVIHLEHISSSGATSLVVVADDFDADTESFDVELYYDSIRLNRLHYTIKPQFNSATRLAWISDSGSIERYTFPVSYRSEREVEKKVITTNNGYHTTACRASLTTSLRSRLEPHAIIDALSHLINSPKVWLEKGRELQSVYVASTAINQNLFGKPDSIALDLCLWHKEVKQ